MNFWVSNTILFVATDFFMLNLRRVYQWFCTMKIFSKLFFFIFLLGGCQHHICDQEKTELVYNPVMQDPAFQHFMQTQDFNVIVPASGIDQAKMKEIQYQLKKTKLHFSADYQGPEELFHVYSDEKRLNDLVEAIHDDKVPYIWCFKGGYGAQKLVPSLDQMKKPKKAKIIIGYSDITALHLFLNQKWGWKTIHGSMVSEIVSPKKYAENFKYLQQLIQNPGRLISYDNFEPLNEIAKNKASVQGQLTGGNLTVLLHTLKTPNEIVTKDKIVILEDVHEKPYRVDRTIHHLLQAGKLKDAKAIVFADFTTENDDEMMNTALQKLAQKINLPVFRWKKCGHAYYNFPFVYGADAIISLNERVVDVKAPYELKFFA